MSSLPLLNLTYFKLDWESKQTHVVLDFVPRPSRNEFPGLFLEQFVSTPFVNEDTIVFSSSAFSHQVRGRFVFFWHYGLNLKIYQLRPALFDVY